MIREHDFTDGVCKHCGGRYTAQEIGKLTCVPRDNAGASHLSPEPARRVYAVDDCDTIYARIREIAAEAETARNTEST